MMKKLYIILTISLFYLLVGCETDKVLYHGPSYLLFDAEKNSYSLKENDKATINIVLGLTVPLRQNLTINISMLEDSTTTAVENYDFEIIDKTVTIPAGQYSTIVRVKAFIENLTEDAVFLKLQYSGVPENLISNAYGNILSLRLAKQLDLTMEWLVGKWMMTDYDYTTNAVADEYEVIISEISADTIAIYNIWDGEHTVKATIDTDNAQISILEDQLIYIHPDPSYGEVYILRYNGGVSIAAITGNCSLNGIELVGWCAYTYLGGGTFGRYGGSILTKVE
ncbi:MAG: hypothetical protein LIO65_05765 [Odoribacter sp.]|nr:hypothetical protein [Odoribacter sp.]